MTQLVSWNVNGIRAAQKKGFGEFLAQTSPDILCLQETKASPDQLDTALSEPDGYHAFFASAEKKGYSGVAIYSRTPPREVRPLGRREFDAEGRTLIAEYADFTLITGYFPNSQAGGARLDYKLAYCDAIHAEADRIVADGGHVVICGDFNIAHTEIDLARPKQNEDNPGYLPQEREWMSSFLEHGYVDTFRHFVSEPGHYSWWSYRARAREKNIGWRIDYHAVDRGFLDRVSSAAIRSDVYGSDHCPVTLDIEVEL